MRLFVAVRIAPDVAQAIAAVVGELRRRVEKESPHARVSWVREEQLHVTVRFIGDADDAQLARLHDSLSPVIDMKPFDAVAKGVGAFPPRGAPRVLWAGIGAGREHLGVLENEVTRRLRECGVESEDRPYRPHITLARIREGSGLRVTPLLTGIESRPLGTWRVDAITLFNSRSSPGGQRYEVVHETLFRR